MPAGRRCAPSACGRWPRASRDTGPATAAGRRSGTPPDHQGTVWPWLIGLDAAWRTGVPIGAALADGLALHLHEWGFGSVSETADGDPPHVGTGCPFQAWSVAELARVWPQLAGGSDAANNWAQKRASMSIRGLADVGDVARSVLESS
jgi:glycogen debranching enzyme